MSNWQPPGSQFSDQYMYGQPPPQRRSSPLFWSLLVGAFIFLAAVGVMAAIVFSGVLFRFGSSGEVVLPEIDEQELKEKHAAVAAAFNSEDVGVSRAELTEVEILFDEIVAATATDHHRGFSRLVDINRLYERIKDYPFTPRLGYLEDLMIKNQLRIGLMCPGLWHRYVIARVEQKTPWDAAVYAYFWDDEDIISEVRMWVTRDESGWKIVDWEELQSAIPESKEWALYIAYGDDARLNNYDQCVEKIIAANEFSAEGDYETAAAMLREAASLNLPPGFRDNALLYLAYAWVRCGETEEALDCCRRMNAPQALPGVANVEALCWEQEGKHRKTLEAATRFESMIGRGPNVSLLKGPALMALGRYREAAAEWQNVLRLEPDNLDALQSLGQTLEDERIDELGEYVENCAVPADMAEDLATNFYSSSELAPVEAMARLMEKLEPNSPRLDFVRGLAKEIDFEYEAAADFYKRAFTAVTDEETREIYVQYFLDAMMSAGKSLEAYEACPDPTTAFTYLVGGYEDGDSMLTADQVKEVLAAHRVRQPDDPWGDYYAAIFLVEDGEYEQAANLLAAGYEKTDDEYLQSLIFYQRLTALHSAGKTIEAYQSATAEDDPFTELAEMCLSDERLEDLESLINLHANAQPDDQWLDYYRGMLELQREEHDLADKFFASGYVKVDDEYLKSSYLWQRIQIRIDKGNPLDAYREAGPPDETFDRLAQHFRGSDQWDDLKRLIELRRADAPNDANLLKWELELLWQNEDYEGMIARLEPWPQQLTEQLDSWTVAQVRERLMRCYLRLDRRVAAAALAQKIYRDEGEPLPMIMVSAIKGDVEQTAQYVEEYAESQIYSFTLYDDQDVGEVLRGDRFAELRRRFPSNVSLYVSHEQVMLLVDGAVTLDETMLRDAASSVLDGQFTIARIASSADRNANGSFVIRQDDLVCCVTLVEGRLEAGMSPLNKDFNESLRRAIDEHQAFLAISIVQSDEEASSSQLPALCKFVRALITDDCLAVYVQSEQRFLENSAETISLLESPNVGQELSNYGEEMWMYYDGDYSATLTDAEIASKRRLRQLTSQFEKQDEKRPFRIQLSLNVGHAQESLWLSVYDIKRGQYGSRQYLGTLVEDSQVLHRFKKGEPLTTHAYSIIDAQPIEESANTHSE